MAFSYAEYKKKKQDQNQNTDDASGKDSTFAGSSERERGTGSFSYSTYREEQKKKKAGSSVQDWLNSSNEFLNEVNQFYSGWQNNTTRNSIYQNRAENLISIADKWREQYANNAEAISQIDSVVSVLSDAKKYVQERHNNYSQWASADDYDAWKSKETFISQYLEDPEKATSTLDYQDDWLKEGQYRMEKNKILGAEDFQDYSQYASTKADNWWDKIWSQYSMGYDDLTYEYINNQDDIRSEISSKSRSFRSDTKDSESVFSENHYDYMTDDEVSIYNYYYAKEGKEKAEEYLNYLGSILEARANNETVENTTKFASEHPIASSVLSVGTSIGSGFEYIEDVLDYGVDKITGKDARLGTNELSLMTNTVRGTVSDMVEWEIGGWDAGAFLYNTAMSGADSLAAGTVFGKFGGAVLGLSAAAQGTNDALERGMSDGQAFWNGLFSGVFEGLFESISIGNFNKLKEVAPESIKDIFKNLGKSMLVNASEETLTEIANIGYDTLINGEFANYTWEELKNGAWKDALFQVLEAGASGALMGVGMSGAGNAIGYHNSSSAAKQTYGSDPGALVGEALEIDPNNAYAQKMQGRLDSGKSLSGGQLMKLNNQVVEGDMQSIQSAAAQRLTELGETGDVEATAAALAKRFSGQELTRKESQLIQNSQYGRRVSTEMNPQNIQSGGFTSGWAEQIGTKRINADEYSRIVEAAQLPQEAAETIGEESCCRSAE